MTRDDRCHSSLAPVADDAWPRQIDDLRAGFAGSLNIYRVMAHHPDLLRAWENLRNHVVLCNSLTPRQQEIIILRTGYRWDSVYEWAHHVVRGRAAGLTNREIEAAREPRPPSDIDADLVRLIVAVDQLKDNGRLADPLRLELEQDAGSKKILDLLATVGMYTTLAFIANSFTPPIDADVTAALVGDWAPGIA